MRPVVLIIRDGWGVNARAEGNSVFPAKTPTIDQIRARYPHCLLDCCGEAVGLPDGYQGSSEVTPQHGRGPHRRAGTEAH